MKIIKHYDVMNQINIANGEIVLPLIKERIPLASFQIALLTSINMICGDSVDKSLIQAAIVSGGINSISIFIITVLSKYLVNPKQIIAVMELTQLFLELNAYLNVETTPDMLLESTQDGRTEYKVTLNENKTPIIMQNKYILIPSYDFKGKIKESSVLQEHQIFPPGSKDYILSIGSKTESRKLKLAHSGLY